jgi:aminoglycoside 3-N-acetyltransferase
MNFVEHLSGVATRVLTPERQLEARNLYNKARTTCFPVMKLMFGTFSTSQLRAHLEKHIDPDFEVLMVHSSINHMMPMYQGTPLELVKMLVDFCGRERTLAMPAFNFGDARYGGAFASLRARPFFDLRRTASQMGLVTELFRRMPSTVQSRHPVYRISACGPHAKDLVEGHEFATDPAGQSTPFDYMTKVKTRIIGIGKTYQVLTQAHHVEGVLGQDFPVPRIENADSQAITVTVLDSGKKYPVVIIPAGMKWDFDIWKLGQIMSPARLETWSFHRVPFFCTRADFVTDDLIAAAKQGKTLYIPKL